MRKHLLLSLLFFLFTGTLALAQQPDSIYFYKDGAIVYGEATTQIDSLTFLPPNYYDLQRSEAVFNELSSHPELSVFTWMILMADYQDHLTGKTIWAPTNDAFADMGPMDLLDINAVRRILNNQMSSMLVTTDWASVGSSKIEMFTGKHFLMSKTSTGYEIAGNKLIQSDLKKANSILHVVDGLNPYPLNIWEYIQQAEGLDSLRSYINTVTHWTTLNYSYYNGNYWDTITVPQGDLFDFLARIDLEDSTYTVLLPENEAFVDAFNRLLPYCANTRGAVFQADAAKWMILKELFFRGRLSDPTAVDFIYSVGGTRYEHPDSLFLGASSSVELTNGKIYRVNQLKAFEPGFQKRVTLIEAENRKTNKLIAANYDLIIYSGQTSNLPVSNGKHLYCRPTSTSALTPLTITVPFPNTLAMKYNLYVVFLPALIADTTDQRPYKLDFYLSTNGDMGTGSTTYAKVNSSVVVTNPTTITKVLVAGNLSIPSCSIFHDPDAPSKIMLRIRNVGGVTATELKNYNRSLRIDYFLLEPVE